MDNYDVVIVGGGPAGAAAAITLAQSGAKVVVLEEKRMPREKLCGEFVTPECLPSLERLGVSQDLTNAGAQLISRLRLIVGSGKSIDAEIPNVSTTGQQALGISRARFDQILFERAQQAGAFCMEGTAARLCLPSQNGCTKIEAMSLGNGKLLKFE